MTMPIYRLTLAIALCGFLLPAMATGNHSCPTGYTGTPPNCKPVVVPDPKPPTNTNGQGQSQTSHNSNQNSSRSSATGGNAAATGGRSSSTSNATGGAGGQGGAGGNSSSTAGVSGSGNASLGDVGSTSGASANGVVSVDAADRSSTNISNRSSFISMADLPANAMNIVAGSMLNSGSEESCGYLQAKVRVPILMWITKRKQVEVGYDEDLVPFRDANGIQQDFRVTYLPDGGMRLSGHRLYKDGAVLGNASSFQLGVQGGKDSSFGGLGYGSGSGQQQIGVRWNMRDCMIATIPGTVLKAKPAPRPVVRKKKPVRRPAPKCVEVRNVCPR